MMTARDDDEDWGKNRKLILSQLDSLSASMLVVNKTLEEIKIEIALLKLRSSFWGAVAGVGGAVVILALEYMRRKP